MDRTTKKIGYIDIPEGYINLSQEEKYAICTKILDKLITKIDRNLPAHINRVVFTMDILESTLITNEEEENYEVCSVIRDIQKILNES